MTQPLSDHGLPIKDTVLQSFIIHPDWSLEVHLSYLVNDAFFDADYVAAQPVAAWLTTLQQGGTL